MRVARGPRDERNSSRYAAVLLAAVVVSAMTPHVGGRGALAAQPGLADLARRTSQQRQAGTARGPVGEEAWIVSTVAAAIGGIVNAGTVGAPERPMRIAVENHLWAPETYAPGVAALLAGASAAEPVDHDVRSPLTDLAVDTLLEQNVRVSALLARAMRSAAAHESAAFLVGAFALRESTDLFGDARPALSRMAAHLAVAQALRGQGQETLDGSLARVILSVLVGHQRAALAALDTLAPRLVTAADRAWDRALRLRITGNWRAPLNVETATLVERLEQARALRSRVGSQALLDSLEPLAREDVTDWARIALSDRFTVSTGWRFTEDVIERELDEAARIWSRLHGGRAAPADLTAALNDRPVPECRDPAERGGRGRGPRLGALGGVLAAPAGPGCHGTQPVSLQPGQARSAGAARARREGPLRQADVTP